MKEIHRNENGLFEGVTYPLDDFGFIDWKAMVPQEYKYPNKDWFYQRGKDVPETAEGLSDDQTIISLAGLKWLARVRGYGEVNNEIVSVKKGTVVAKCTIVWMPLLRESRDKVSFSDCASASVENTTGHFGPKFLETIAVNRAFCRCVRNSLGINSVSDVELENPNPEKAEKVDSDKTKPQFALEEIAKGKGFESFESLRAGFTSLGYFHEKSDLWVEYKNIPAKECRILISKLRA